MMRQPMGSAANAIVRRVTELLQIDAHDRQKPILVVEACRSEAWASLTFDGERVTLDLRLAGAGAGTATVLEHLGAEIAEGEIPIPGGFIAEIGVTMGDWFVDGDENGARQFMVEALVIRD